MDFIESYLEEAKKVIGKLDKKSIENVIDVIASVKKTKGRLFFIGVGGGAGHASHAVNDFRKIVGIESYCISDNVSELTARINDNGWDTCYEEWLKTSNCNANDCIFVFSVGGGNVEKGLSVNITKALQFGKSKDCKVVGILGKSDGFTAKVADSYVLVPNVNQNNLTAHTESFQALIWHLMVSHPKLMQNSMKWESTDKKG